MKEEIKLAITMLAGTCCLLGISPLLIIGYIHDSLCPPMYPNDQLPPDVFKIIVSTHTVSTFTLWLFSTGLGGIYTALLGLLVLVEVFNKWWDAPEENRWWEDDHVDTQVRTGN